MNLEERLTRRLVRDGDCLRWTGSHTSNGYGKIRNESSTIEPVHRVAHRLWIGPIPEGYEVDHVYANGCRHTDCVEPKHLEAVPPRENTLRYTRRITHCPRGHEYSEENTIMRTSASGHPARQCRQCGRDRVNARRRAGKAVFK